MKKISFVLFATFIIFSCNNKSKKIPFPAEHAVFGVVKPLKLSPDAYTVFLKDFIVNTELIDSVTFDDDNISASYIKGVDTLALTFSHQNVSVFNPMNLWVKGCPYTILLEKSDKISYHFTFNPQGKEYQEVGLAGDINNWNPANTPLTLLDGLWQTTLTLDPGTYQYLVVPDKQWVIDFNNADSASNNMGGFNSLLKVENALEGLSPVLVPAHFNEKRITVAVKNNLNGFFVLWENFLLKDVVYDTVNQIIEINIPIEACSKDYSNIRVYGWNKGGKANDLLIPLSKGKVINEANELTRFHKEAQIYYFLLTDRFFNGDKDIDEPLKDPQLVPLTNFMGGDLVGITKKIKEGYFDSLHINTLWLSPLSQNPLIAYNEYPEPHRKFSGYHGYWPVNSTAVDYRFGSDKCLEELVNEAHKRNINVILDFVANHVHEDNPIIKDNPNWATKVELPDGFNIRKWDEHRLTTWFDTFLPSFDFAQQEVVDTITSLGVYWIKKFNLDGFRHDATKHIPLHFWRAMTMKLKTEVMEPQNRSLMQIGETFGNRDLIGSYVGNGLLDGQFDFNLYFDARAVFALDNESFDKVKAALNGSFNSYGYHSLMGNITGNHDLPRFTSLASGDLRFDENAKDAAWNRKVEITNIIGYLKMAQFMAFNMTIPGIPVIYYGDEIGMPGADDPDNRRMMQFDNLNEYQRQLRGNLQEMAALKRKSMALNYGHFQWLETSQKSMAYIRTYFDESLIMVFNKDSVAKMVEVSMPDVLSGSDEVTSLFGHQVEWVKNTLQVEMSPYGYDFISVKGKGKN